MAHPDDETLSQLMDGEWQDPAVRGALPAICSDAALRAKWSRYHLARDAMRREPLRLSGDLAARVGAALADEPAYTNVTTINGAGGAAAVAAPNAVGIGEAGAGDGAPLPPDAPVAMSTVSTTSARHRSGRASARGWGTAVAGFGLAAGVAALTVFGLDALRGGADGGASAAAPPASVAALGPVVAGGGDPLGAFSRQPSGLPLPEVELVANTGASAGAYWATPDATETPLRSRSEERLNMFLSQHIESSPTGERQGMLPYSRLVGYDERGGQVTPER